MLGASAEDSRRANRTGPGVKMINRPERVWRFWRGAIIAQTHTLLHHRVMRKPRSDRVGLTALNIL